MINTSEKLTILVVDDSDIIRNSLKNFFSEYDLEVLTSSDGLDGIQKAVKYKPVLIFLDLLMPSFDGIKMLQVIKVLDNIKTIPVIVISGNTNRTNVIASIEAGAERVISKPLKKEIILKNINELLGYDFLTNIKKAWQISDSDKKDITKKLCESFLKNFPEKKIIIQKCLKNQEITEIKNIAHDLKGEGGMIGVQKLSVLGGLIENGLASENVNWGQVKLMYEQVFTIVSEMEKIKLSATE